jgi:RNA polymerase sigma-70 factor, ECF subfamily
MSLALAADVRRTAPALASPPLFRRAPASARPGDSVEEAMERFAGGEEAAFELVYTMAAPFVRRCLVRLTREPASAEDLTQETLLRMYRARGTWRSGARVLPWARSIARRLFIDRLRRRRNEEAAHDLFTQSCDGGPFAGADVHLAARRMAEIVSSTVDRLPPGQREAFRLIGEEGLSLSEACAKLGDTNLAVRLRVHRARRALQTALAEH